MAESGSRVLGFVYKDFYLVSMKFDYNFHYFGFINCKSEM